MEPSDEFILKDGTIRSRYSPPTVIKRLLPSAQVTQITGSTYTLFNFGDSIGQVEIDSPDCKSLKADYYVLNSCNNLVHIMSNTGHKTSLKQVSALPAEVPFNSNTTVITPDFCPVVGKSTKLNNLYYNFGSH